MIWCDIGIGNIFYRISHTGKYIFSLNSLMPMLISPLKSYYFWTSDLIIFNSVIFFTLCLLINYFLKTIVVMPFAR
jgi:hypothetical protein